MDERALEFMVLMTPRSGQWPALAAAFLRENPYCAVCGKNHDCVPHHIIPVHIDPDKELYKVNLVTLCPEHHLLFGHFMNWRSYNPNVLKDAAEWKLKIQKRIMP